MRYTLLLLTILIFSVPVTSQVLQWAKKIDGPQVDFGGHSTVDKFGNLYLCGSFQGSSVDFDPGVGTFLLNSAGQKDGFVAKYDVSGNFVWAFRIGGSNQDEVNDLVLDSNGNLIITGYFRGPGVDFDPSGNNAILSSNGESGGDPGYGGDIFVAKYTVAGNYLWAFNVGGADLGDNGISVACDKNNDIFVTGYFRSTVDFDPSSSVANLNQSGGTFFLAKYSSAGQYRWAFNTGEGGIIDNTGFKVACDNANNVVVTGFYQGTSIDFDPSAGVASLSSNGGFEFFVAKYAGDRQFLWAKSAGGSGADVGRSLTIDNADNIYVTGDYNSSNINFNNGVPGNTLTNNGGNDLFVVKYSPSGAHLWSFGTGGGGNELGMDVCRDNDGNILITGAFTGTNVDFDPSFNVITLSSKGGNDIYAVKYSASGLYLCSFTVGGAGNDIGRGIANFGNYSFVTGSFNGTNIDFDPTSNNTLLSSNNDAIFISKYDWTIIPPAGVLTGSSNCLTGQSQLTFTATSGTGPFTLYINNGTTTNTYTNIQSGVSFNLTPSPTVTTTYTLTGIKDANLCSAVTPANSAVIINPSSIPITTSGNAAICRLDSVQLNASGGITYQWSPSTGLSNTAIPNPKASPSVTTVYKVVVTNGAGCKDSATLTVSIKPQPVISISPDNAAFCPGDSVQLTATGGNLYQWSPSAGLSDPTISNPKAAPLTTTTYNLVVVNSDGCKDSLTKTVTKNISPVATVSSPVSICPGDSTQLSASGGVSYQWLPSAGLNNSTIANPNASPGVTTVYKVIVTDIQGCKDSATTTVSLKPKPLINLSSPAPVCKGDTAQLNASGGVSYQWSPAIGLNNVTISNPKASPAITTTYSVLVTGINNCIDSASAVVTINQPPSITLTADTFICAGDSVQLTASGGASYQWLPAGGLSASDVAAPKASPAGTTTYKVLVYSAAACIDSAFVTVTVKPKPVIGISSSVSICRADTTQLMATGGINYQWSPSTGLSNATVPGPFASPSTNTIYNVVVSNADGCKDSAQTTVSVTPKPLPNLGKDTTICIDETVVLNATTNSGLSYRWNTGETTPAISVDQPGIYSVMVDIAGCTSPAADTILVEDLPPPTVSLRNDTTVCSTYILQLEAKGTNIENYTWSTGSTDSFILVNTQGQYSITVNNKCGTASDIVAISVNVCADDLYFPSGFTPNNDNKNDLFKAAYLQGFEVFDYQLQVFNRWGQRVFITNDVTQGWDGKINGKEQPNAVFVWLAKYRKTKQGDLIVRKGTATLIR